MRSDIVSIEPQIVQFGRSNTQTIKIINNTSSSIANFFFCLYNTEKFQFSPDSFALSPNEHKLITITLKIKSTRSMAKQFAYLKSSEINKRVTLLINNFQSPEMKRSRLGEEGMEDINTLSSREYKDIQTQAIEKIIREKDAYIEMLEKDKQHSANKNVSFRTEESAEKIYLYKREAEELEIKLALAANQKQAILKENLALQEKFEEYRKYCETDLKNYEKVNAELNERNGENIKLQEEVQYLQDQGQQFLHKLEEKQGKIRELEQLNKKAVEDQRKEAEKKYKHLEERLEEQKKASAQSSKQSEERIRELQRKLQLSESVKEKGVRLQKQLKRKQDELRNLTAAFETERNTLKQLQGQKKKLIKYELMNESINEKNNELSSRLKQYEHSNITLREQIFAYKSKLAQNDVSSDKMNQYLQIALESCRNENEGLKRSKNEMQKSLDEFMHINRQSHDNNKSLSEQLCKYKEEINLLIEIKDNLERRNEELKQEHHLALMQLKSENIGLLERLSYGESTKREEKIRKLQDELAGKVNEIEVYRSNNEEAEGKMEELVRDNNRLSEKVKKYKKEAKRQLRSINDTAISQLHREHDEKKRMAQRIIQLEEVIVNYSCEKEKRKSGNKRDQDTRLHNGLETESNVRKERASSRIIGIKDQRRQINETSKAYSVTSQEQACAELGELRELNSYIRNQEDRLTRMFELECENEAEESSLKLETRPIFRVIQFFKKIENKMREFKGESQLVNIKEIEYLKGRLRELQSTKQVKENSSSMNLSKTREQCGQLLEYVREEMKNQYKKLNETTKLWERKYELLKRKIFEEYRSKIVDLLNKKEKSSVGQLEVVLQRFIDGMSNLSHKEAVLQKEVKLKQNARKTNVELKEKVSELNSLLQSKKGYCSREPLKMVFNETEIEWQESLKREAEFLTLTAEYQRLKEQFELVSEELSDGQQQLKTMERQVDDKSAQILRLKKHQVEIQSNYQSEIQKQFEIIEENKRRIMEMTKSTKESTKSGNRQREYNNLKENFQRQKEIVKVLRDKEKMLEDILEESHRSEEKERKKVMEETRVTETIRDLKDNNRDLRNENGKLKDRNTKLEEELEKKSAYLKNLKGDLQDNRVRVQKKEQVQSQKLRDEAKRLTQELRKAREEIDKIKKKKDHEFSELRNDIDRLKNQSLITQKSLESIIRAIMSTIKKVYGRLRRYIKKRNGRLIEDHQKIFETSQGVHINALEIDEIFEEVLGFLEQGD